MFVVHRASRKQAGAALCRRGGVCVAVSRACEALHLSRSRTATSPGLSSQAQGMAALRPPWELGNKRQSREGRRNWWPCGCRDGSRRDVVWLSCTTSRAGGCLAHRWPVAGASHRRKEAVEGSRARSSHNLTISQGASTPTCPHRHSARRPPPVAVAEHDLGSVSACGRRPDPAQRTLSVPKATWDPALLLVCFMHEAVTRCLHPACFVVATGKPPNSYSTTLPRFLVCRVLPCRETPSPTRTCTTIEVPGT
jgi:hypothetical protein